MNRGGLWEEEVVSEYTAGHSDEGLGKWTRRWISGRA